MLLTQDISCYARTLVQICVWREARGDSAAWAAVTWVILNRAHRIIQSNPLVPLDEAIQHVVTAHAAFSSMTILGDPNTIQWPLPSPVWNSIANAVDDVLDGHTPDPTDSATFYFSAPLTEAPASWGAVTKTAQFGSIQTFKEV